MQKLLLSELQSFENSSAEEALIQFVDQVISQAEQLAASDIHIEPYEKNCRLRYRLDGLLHTVAELPHPLAQRMIARLKVMAKLDIAEKRLPQDGRLRIKTAAQKNIQLRLATCPVIHGEKLVLRLLTNTDRNLGLADLGLTESQKELFLSKISQPQGLILVTGPTGSGKTATLYAILQELNRGQKNILTVEDPVELQLDGINQVQINPKIGLHFSNALRVLLRQDPDIIMIGEIRDLETANIALQAAQTGHLVLASLHTNSALETLARLSAMGCKPYTLLSSLSLIVAQRLVRLLCSYCRSSTTAFQDADQFLPFASHEKDAPGPVPDKKFFIKSNGGEGCHHCSQGYKGRTGIFECLSFKEKLASLILKNASNSALLKAAQAEGFKTLQEIGFEKCAQGLTTREELAQHL